MKTATYTKLQNGTWGIRVTLPAPSVGESVTVTTKAGQVKTETVEKVLWQGNGVAICAIAQRAGNFRARPTASRYYGRNRDNECELCGRNRYTCGHCIGW